MNKFLKVFFVLFFSLLIGNYTLAGCKCNGVDTNYDQSTCSNNGCQWIIENNAPSANTPVRLTNPLGDGPEKTSIPILLGKIISSVLGIIGSLALVMFIYGGATWMMSTGNQEQVTKGKNILIWATVGIVIIFTAYALVKFVLDTVTGAR